MNPLGLDSNKRNFQKKKIQIKVHYLFSLLFFFFNQKRPFVLYYIESGETPIWMNWMK